MAADSANNSVDDLMVGQECSQKLGTDESLRLLGTLLRLHCLPEYQNYLQSAQNHENNNDQLQLENKEREANHMSILESADGAQSKSVAENQIENSQETNIVPTKVSETEALHEVETALAPSQDEPANASENAHQTLEEEKEEATESIPKPEITLKDRALARSTRWDADGEDLDSGDEAESALSSLGRTLSLFTSVVGIGFTMALSSDPTAAGKQIAQMCRSQGGIYIKAAQSASSMQFAFPDEVLQEFASLQDGADPQDWSEIEERVEKHTPGGIDYIYESFEHESINAASIAQVHVAQRRSGEKVAVKVLRRRIQSTFDKDITNYLGLLGQYEKATGISVKWMQEWVMEELKKEIDFRHEATLHEEAADRISSSQELQGKLYVPTLHSELCTKRLLVAEFIDGCKITQMPTFFSDWNRERDLPQLFDVLETWSAMQIFKWGKFHGDPHPGNILVRRKQNIVPEGETPFEIVVIDHGGYYELAPATRELYAELWCMMDKARDENHRLARKARVQEILAGWGVEHYTRYVIEQLFGGHFGTADPTSDIKENGQARMHRYNLMNQNGKEYGPEMFSDTSKMPPELMKAQGAASFLMGIWNALGQKMPGWNAPERRRGIMMRWAAQSAGMRKPP